MAPGYGINSIGYANDPYFMYALNSYNPNFMAAQQTQTTQTQTQVQNTQTTNPSFQGGTQNLPKADYSEKSNAGTIIGGLTIAAGAAALIYAGRKGKLDGVKKFFNSAKETVLNGSNSIKTNVKNFSLKAKDDSLIVVKDGKIEKILKKDADKVITETKEINKILNDKKLDDLNFKDYKDLFAKGRNIKLNKYSFETTYAGKTVRVENGKIISINGVNVSNEADIIKNLGNDKGAITNIQKRIERFEQNHLSKKDKITKSNILEYEWTANGYKGVASVNKGGRISCTELTELGSTKKLTDAEKKAFLENNKDLDSQVNKLIKGESVSNVAFSQARAFDSKGNRLVINDKGEIVLVELKNPIDVNGKKVNFLRDGKDRTLLDSWLYDNPEAKEFAKKQLNENSTLESARFVAL